MSYKESQLLQEDNFEPQTLHHLAMLNLTSTTPSSSSTKPQPRFKKCSQCGTLKRRSPSLQQPSPKKPNLLTTPSLSPSPWNVTPPKQQQPLHRSLSENIYSETEKMNGSGSSAAFNTISPENSKTPTTSSSPSSAVVGSILRSISDPTVAATSPPLNHVQRTHTPLSPVSEESPTSRRVKRMKKRMKEMSKWVGEVMKEEDDEDHVSEDHDTTTNSKDENESEHQEAVWVEKKGDGLVIHFKCPCGEGYEIFLCGNNCYYKLM